MKLQVRIIFTFVLLSMLITSTSGQDYYDGELTYKFSDRLKEGVELTWIISQFSIVLPEYNESEQPTTYTGYDEYTTTDSNGDEVVETVTYEYSEDGDYYYAFPDIPENTLLKVIILKDLTNITNEYYYIDFFEQTDEYFDMSVSQGNETEITDFLGPELLFRPSIVEFENGTVMNAIEYDYKEQQKNLEENTETYDDPYFEDSSTELSIVDGVYTEKVNYQFGNESNIVELRTNVDTGVLLYVYALSEGLDYRFEIEMKLHETVGIDLNYSGPNEELSLPLSPFFVYALLITPIIVNKVRRYGKPD